MDILIFGEEESVLADIREILEDNLFRVRIIEQHNLDVDEGFRRQGKPEIVMFDIGMEVTDEMNVLSKILDGTDSPVIVIGSTDHTSRLVDALEKGATDYLFKPVIKKDLLETIGAAVGR